MHVETSCGLDSYAGRDIKAYFLQEACLPSSRYLPTTGRGGKSGQSKSQGFVEGGETMPCCVRGTQVSIGTVSHVQYPVNQQAVACASVFVLAHQNAGIDRASKNNRPRKDFSVQSCTSRRHLRQQKETADLGQRRISATKLSCQVEA